MKKKIIKKNKLKFYPLNLGCKVNAYETRAVSLLLIKHGYTLGDKNNFDIALINTCTVTHVASQKSRQQVRKLRNLNPKAIIVVMGCYAEGNAKLLANECGADIVIGVDKRNKVAELINKYVKNKKKIIMPTSGISYLRNKIKYEELGIVKSSLSTRQYVKISDGCNNFCSYCIIPTTRGRLRSRNKDKILCEIKSLINDGAKEIVLTGIDTSSYGKDLSNYNFSDLLSDILEKNPDLFRLRISSIEISEIDKKFLSLLSKYNNIANHLHIPLQSGSNSVLKRMNRKYTCEEYLNKINMIRKVRKDIAITTDVIVGYPEETNKEFNETYGFIKKVGFSQLHVFPFSPRINTVAYKRKDIDANIKKERVNKLLKLNEELKKKYYKKFINKKLIVLFEKNNSGLTSNYIKVTGKYKPNTVHTILIKNNNIID